MPAFDLKSSLRGARARLNGGARSLRARRSDAGRMRMRAELASELRAQLLGYDRPKMRDLLKGANEFCRSSGLRCPSRATVYKFLEHVEPVSYGIKDLPAAVRAALYNLPGDGEVPGPQLAFYGFNYGDLSAVSFAAGLPWLNLYQALRMRGWRPKSRGLATAVCRVRGIA